MIFHHHCGIRLAALWNSGSATYELFRIVYKFRAEDVPTTVYFWKDYWKQRITLARKRLSMKESSTTRIRYQYIPKPHAEDGRQARGARVTRAARSNYRLVIPSVRRRHRRASLELQEPFGPVTLCALFGDPPTSGRSTGFAKRIRPQATVVAWSFRSLGRDCPKFVALFPQIVLLLDMGNSSSFLNQVSTDTVNPPQLTKAPNVRPIGASASETGLQGSSWASILRVVSLNIRRRSCAKHQNIRNRFDHR